MVFTKIVILLCVISSALVLLAAGCGDDKTSEPDTTAPAAVEDLRVTSTRR
jgi:multisubunit Na+/H+ antiporter MnhC subunit